MDGLRTAIADGTFWITTRPADGGRGLDGVIERADGYVNPAIGILEGADAAAAPVLSQAGPGAVR
jgi:beta-lysine 5,6-aminomutase alpha subunit